MNSLTTTALFLVLVIAIDSYLWRGITTIIPRTLPRWKRIIRITFWGFTAFTIVAFILLVMPGSATTFSMNVRRALMVLLWMPLISKLLTVIILLVDDIRRLIVYFKNRFQPKPTVAINHPKTPTIPRSEFLTKAALLAGGGLAGTFTFGIVSGAHDYRIHRIKVPLANLPRQFHGMKIAQLSDIHTGSFFNKTAVKGGVEMLLAEKPDLAVFTGDLVNDRTIELKEYYDIFKHVKAPLGTFSILGNHDYGEYYQWNSEQEKRQNLIDMHKAHERLGWTLMNDIHRPITVDNEQIALLGIQNWGGGRFPKYGDLAKAADRTENFPVKILLSHDPSHWDLQVLPEFKQIDLMLAGHTHGMQFGVEIGDFRWSPSQYRYHRWAGLYKEQEQYLYVNRGFGYLGYPGRVGILPEITILELVKA